MLMLLLLFNFKQSYLCYYKLYSKKSFSSVFHVINYIGNVIITSYYTTYWQVIIIVTIII